MTLAKTVTKTLDIGVKDTKIDLSAIIKSYDLTDTKFIFNIISNQGLNIDLTGSTAMYIVEYVHNSQNYAIQGEVDIVDSTTIAFSLPEDLKGYRGNAIIGLYVQMADGTKIDLKDIVVKIEPSIMDKDIDFLAKTYFKDFETIKAEVILEGEKVKTDINAVVSDVNSYSESQKQAINAVVADVQSTGDTAKADIKATLPTLQGQVSELKEDLTDIVTLDDSFPLSESMFQMGYIDAVVGNVPVYRLSTSRFVTKKGTSFTFKKGTIIHVNTSTLEQYGVAFQITKLNSDGTISSVNGLYYQDYVVPSDGKYILMFRTNFTQDIPSISDYLTQVSIDNNTPIVDVSNSYGKYISNEVGAIPFAVMNGLYQINGNVGSQDTRNLEQYTNKIKVPTSRRMVFEQSLSTAKDMFVRYITFDADGTLIGYETPMNLVHSSSTKLEINVADNIEYVVFTFRSYGLTTDMRIYADNPANKSKYTPFYSLITPPKVPLINHRGYETVAPENSIPAFTLAGERGAFGVECDVSSTSDGVLIIMHDNTVDRTTDGSGTVTSLTYAQIQQMHIDAGANVDQYSQEELVIPTFDDFIKICRKYGMVATIEVKLYGDLGNYVTSMLDTIYKYGMQNNVMILTINADVIKMFRAYDKDIQITLFCTNTSVVDDYRDYGNMGISIDKSTSNIGTLAEYAHSNNMLVSIYTAEDATDEENLKQYFPDFITTETTLNE